MPFCLFWLIWFDRDSLTILQTWSQLVEGEVYDKKKLDAFVGTQ